MKNTGCGSGIWKRASAGIPNEKNPRKARKKDKKNPAQKSHNSKKCGFRTRTPQKSRGIPLPRRSLVFAKFLTYSNPLDLSPMPIANVSALVKQKHAGRQFRSHDEIWEATHEAWYSITAEQLMKLIESMPRRLEAVIKANDISRILCLFKKTLPVIV